jgi:hypothetical protein
MEVAGVVLGAFPIVVWSVQQYQTALEPLSDWWHYRTQFIKFSRDVATQRLFFEAHLEDLITSAIHDPVATAKLLAEPGGDGWKDPELARKLQHRLPKSFHLFMDTVNDIHSTLQSFKKRFGIELIVRCHRQFCLTKQEPWPGASTILGDSYPDATSLERIKIALKKKSLMAEIEGLKAANATLKELLSSSDKLAHTRARQNLQLPSWWTNLGEGARSLFEAIAESWRCDCRPSHCAALLLDPTSKLQGRSPNPSVLPIPHIFFNLWFSFASTPLHPSPWSSHFVTIRSLVKLPLDEPQDRTMEESGQQSRALNKQVPQTSRRLKKKTNSKMYFRLLFIC